MCIFYLIYSRENQLKFKLFKNEFNILIVLNSDTITKTIEPNMFSKIIATTLIATCVAYPIVKDIVVNTPNEVIHINVVIEERVVDTTTTTTTTVVPTTSYGNHYTVVPTTTGLSFNKDDEIIQLGLE